MKKAIWPKLALALCLVMLAFSMLGNPSQYSYALSTGQAFVIAYQCPLYTMPDAESDKVTRFDQENNQIEITLKLHDSVTVHQIENDFAYVSTSDQVQGWMYKYHLTQNTSQDVYPVFNATIMRDTIVYQEDEETKITDLQKGTRVFIFNGFDKSSTYTAVQFTLDDSTLCNGYVLTTDVEPDGISKSLIIAITVILAAVTIILSLVFIKKKKSHGKKNKSA